MALIPSDCDAMRVHEHRMAPITSECAFTGKRARNTTNYSESDVFRDLLGEGGGRPGECSTVHAANMDCHPT